MPSETITVTWIREDDECPLLHDTSQFPKQSPEANFKLTFAAVMICAFLAAFDLTVIAAVYPVMYKTVINDPLMLVLLISKVPIELRGLPLRIFCQPQLFSPSTEDFLIYLGENPACYLQMLYFCLALLGVLLPPVCGPWLLVV